MFERTSWGLAAINSPLAGRMRGDQVASELFITSYINPLIFINHIPNLWHKCPGTSCIFSGGSESQPLLLKADLPFLQPHHRGPCSCVCTASPCPRGHPRPPAPAPQDALGWGRRDGPGQDHASRPQLRLPAAALGRTRFTLMPCPVLTDEVTQVPGKASPQGTGRRLRVAAVVRG